MSSGRLQMILLQLLYEKKTTESPLFAERIMVTGNSLSLMVSHIFLATEHFMGIALHSADHKCAKRLTNFGDTFVISPQTSQIIVIS